MHNVAALRHASCRPAPPKLSPLNDLMVPAFWVGMLPDSEIPVGSNFLERVEAF